MAVRKGTRQRILESVPDICALCGQGPSDDDPWTIDHKTPRCLGGSNAEENLQKAHAFCNLLHGAQLHLWLLELEREKKNYPELVFDPSQYLKYVS